MPGISKEILQELRSILAEPTFNMVIDPELGAQAPEYRQKIHALIAGLPGKISYSVSHTQGLGGFSTCQANKKIGFDIEVQGRVSLSVANRVSQSPDELTQAPSADHLWVAKEAAFKALQGPHQPQVIGSLKIGGWKKMTGSKEISKFETYQLETDLGLNDIGSSGVTFEYKGFILGAFIRTPQILP